MKRVSALHQLQMSKLPVLLALIGLLLVSAPTVARAADSSDNSSGDMVVFGGQHETVKAGQEVTGDLVVIGGSADVYGIVDGDGVALGGKIYIAPQGHVNGSLVNLGGVIDNQSQSAPKGHRVIPPTPPATETPAQPLQPEQGGSSWFNQDWVAFFFVDGLLALVAFLLFPVRTHSAREHLLDNPVMAGMLGFFSPIIFVLVIIALAITVIGIPLIPLAIILTIVGYLIGKAAIAEFLGERIFDVAKWQRGKPLGTVGLGLFILALVCAITGWLGIVFYFCLGALAIGASLYALMRTAQTYRRPPTLTPPPASTQFSPPAPSPTTPPAVP